MDIVESLLQRQIRVCNVYIHTSVKQMYEKYLITL